MKEKVIEALKKVIDPEVQINIIDMGLVYNVEILEEEKKIIITMTLSSPHCPMGNTIVAAVQNCLGFHFVSYKGEVNLVWEPAWSIDKISEEGKQQLAFGN